jgi:N4-gp56 family major capsid protein
MADAVTNVAAVNQDVLNVWIARQTYALAERRLQLGKFASRYTLPQRMGKTMRIVRYRRLALPTTTLTEGVPPDAVALSVENVDVTVEQWGIVVLITDVAQVVPTHPALQMAIERTGMAMSELLERETATTLMGGTNVFYPGATATSRATLTATDKVDTAVILKVLSTLRSRGAMEFASGQFGGVMPPQVVSDVLASDATFKDATGQSAYEKLEYGTIGDWMNVRWVWGNFLPIYKAVPAPTTGAATAEKAMITAVDGGGTITSAGNFKFAVVARDAKSGYERKISLTSANIAAAATGNNESFTIGLPTSTNYVYDVYMSAVGGTGNLFKVKSAVSGATTTITAEPVGTEATLPVAPAPDQMTVFTTFVFGKGAFGRVELDGMSLQSYLTEAGASYSNPLAQGRKVGSKIMWKCFIIDNDFYARIESGSAYSADLPA